MFSEYYPYEYAKSVFTIDYEKLKSLGYRGLIFDIDNTLVHHGDDATNEVEQLFSTLHRQGFYTCLLTNNDEARVERFIKNIDTIYVCDADKPNPKGYTQAIEKMGLSKSEAVMIGDQLFTDIQGANRCGIASILVEFIRLPGVRKIGKKRQLERLILALYRRSKRFCNRFDKIELQRGETYGTEE